MTRKFALIIGNSHYEDPALAKLKTPEADAHALADALRDPAIGGFDEVQELLNESEAKVRRAISSFFIRRKPDDLLLLYFSGHGVLDPQGRLFLAVRDTQRELLNATSIPAAFITDDMDSSRSKRQVLILDCCHSGAFARGAKGEAAAITRNTFEGNGFGRVVLTASDSTQYALEGDQVDKTVPLSLFTNYLLEGLTTGEADRGGDGWISVDEWYDYAYERVLNQTPSQTPKKWAYNTQGDLVIARNPKPKPVKPVELPPYLLTALKSELPLVRLEGVDQLEALLLGTVPELAAAAAEELQRMAQSDDSFTVRKRATKALENSPLEAAIASEEEAENRQREERLEALYRRAEEARQSQRLDEARGLLVELQQEGPGYRDVEFKLKEIDRERERERAREKLREPARPEFEKPAQEGQAHLAGVALEEAGSRNIAQRIRDFAGRRLQRAGKAKFGGTEALGGSTSPAKRLWWPALVSGLIFALGWASLGITEGIKNDNNPNITVWSISIPSLLLAGGVALSLAVARQRIPRRSVGLQFLLWWVGQALALWLLYTGIYEGNDALQIGWLVIELAVFAASGWLLQRSLPAANGMLILAGWVAGFIAASLVIAAIATTIDPYGGAISRDLGLAGFVMGTIGGWWMHRQLRKRMTAETA